MKPDQQRIEIAKACGWKYIPPGKDDFGVPYPELANKDHVTIVVDDLPDYLNDLNAIHEAEKQCLVSIREQDCFRDELCEIVYRENKHRPIYNCTAAQRSECLLKTLCLWQISN